MSSSFAQKKASILRALQTPEQDYTDLSPKGSVDEGILDLCNEINALDGLVTTSSCAGRVSVFLDGPSQMREKEDHHDVVSSGGKGGGRWLYVSHHPIDMTGLAQEGALYALTGINSVHSPLMPSPSGQPRFVHFKFEPMILHILTSSLDHAQRVLTAALSAGFRESGISSIAGDNPSPIVAVRTQGLALESIIAFHEQASDCVYPMVSEDYLRSLLRLANQRFMANTQRKERFQSSLLRHHASEALRVSAANDIDWEPANLRAERKRAEGLRRREEMRLRNASSAEGTGADELFGSNEFLSAGLFPD